MSYKMSVYYQPADDSAAFEKRYMEGHLPIVRENYSKMEHASFHKVARKVVGEFAYGYVFTGTWADQDAWQADMGSQGGQAVLADAMEMGAKMDVVTFDQLD